MDTAIEQFLQNRRKRSCSENAIKTYRSQLTLLARSLTPKAILDATTSDLNSYIEKLNGHSPFTVRQRATAYRTFYRWALDSQAIEHDPTRKGFFIPKRPRRLPRALSPEQVKQLIDATQSARDRAIIYLMLDSGIRRAELSALTLDDLDLARGMALVRKGKGNKERWVLFASQTTTALHTWLKERKAPKEANALFTTRYSKPMQPGGVYKTVRKAAHRAGVKARPHVLRHTFATNYIDRGGTLCDAQTLLGHEDISTTMIYVSVSLEHLRQKHKQLSLLDELLKTQG